MFARIGIMRALNRHVERVFDPSRKEKHWGRRKLAWDLLRKLAMMSGFTPIPDSRQTSHRVRKGQPIPDLIHLRSIRHAQAMLAQKIK
jgi:hypothetical protein